MPALRKRSRRGEASSSPVGEDRWAKGPTTLTTVSAHCEGLGVPDMACRRCPVRLGASQTNNPASPRLTARKTSVENSSMSDPLHAYADDLAHDQHAHSHEAEHVLDDRDTDRVGPQ